MTNAGGAAATWSGAVTINGTATINTPGKDITISGVVSGPGNCPGIQTFTDDLTCADGSTFEWELIGNTAAPTERGTSYDGVNGSGTNTLLIDSSTDFLVILDSIGSIVDFDDSLWKAPQSWTVFSGFDSRSGLFTNLTVIDPSNGQYYSDYGDFSLVGTSDGLTLDWTPVPEPSAPLALALLLSSACFARRRK